MLWKIFFAVSKKASSTLSPLKKEEDVNLKLKNVMYTVFDM